MLMMEAREQLVHYGKELITQHLTTGTGGNLSVFDRKTGLMAITPSGIDFFATRPEDIVIMTLDGQVVEGSRKPSSEVDLHRIFYQHRADIDALVHSHSLYCTTISCMGWEIPPVHYVIGVAGKSVRCTPYHTFGTPQLAQAALEGMEDRYAVLLGNHGMIAGARTLEDAFGNVRSVEFVAQLYYHTRCLGTPKLIGDREMDQVLAKFQTYGQPPTEKN